MSTVKLNLTLLKYLTAYSTRVYVNSIEIIEDRKRQK